MDEKALGWRYGCRELLGKVGGTGGNSPQMVSTAFIMWEVRSATEGKNEVGVDENVLVNCGGEFYRVSGPTSPPMVALSYVC